MKTAKTTKEIAKEIREAFKSMKDVKLSVTSEYNHIYIHLMEAPFQPVTNNEIVYKGHCQRNSEPKQFEGYYGVNHRYYKSDENLTIDSKVLFQLVDEIISKYHWDESDSMTDYFNCAFYFDYAIGKWDKPFVQKEVLEPVI